MTVDWRMMFDPEEDAEWRRLEMEAEALKKWREELTDRKNRLRNRAIKRARHLERALEQVEKV